MSRSLSRIRALSLARSVSAVARVALTGIALAGIRIVTAPATAIAFPARVPIVSSAACGSTVARGPIASCISIISRIPLLTGIAIVASIPVIAGASAIASVPVIS